MWRAFVSYASSLRRSGLGSLASTTDCRPKSAVISGTAPPMNSKRLRDVQLLLESRAAKATNKSLRALYLRQHQNLRRGA